MTLELHVRGEIRYGHLTEFLEAVQAWQAYRSERGWVIPRVLFGLSGPMNLVVMVFEYPDANRLEMEDAAEAADPKYGEIAGKLGFREPSIVYELYRPALE
jgi:hypothetical protein